MTTISAFFRASNIMALDYCPAEALRSALDVCDEAIVVADQNSVDDTLVFLGAQQAIYGPDRFQIAQMAFKFDREWQVRAWNAAAEVAQGEWLWYWDLDEVLHEWDYGRVLELVADDEIDLISFPYYHFYATPGWYVDAQGFYKRNTRLGRRSVQFHMANHCTDEKHAPVCDMMAVLDGQLVSAHAYAGEGIARQNVPHIYHYGWCRDATALGVRKRKGEGWYGDKAELYGSDIPDVKPYPLDLPSLYDRNEVLPFKGSHPAVMETWFSAHKDLWAGRELTASQC